MMAELRMSEMLDIPVENIRASQIQHQAQEEQVQEFPLDVSVACIKPEGSAFADVVEEEKKGPSGKVKDFFSQIKRIVSNKESPRDKRNMAVIIGESEVFDIVKTNSYFSVSWKVENQSEKVWPKGCNIRNLTKDINVPTMTLKEQLKPGEITDVQISVFVPATFKKSEIVLQMSLEDNKG